MVVCFICKNKYNYFGAFKPHLNLSHDVSEYRTLICNEGNCDRKFQLLNSFRRHLLTHSNKADDGSISSGINAESNTSDSVVSETFDENLDEDVEPTLEPTHEVSPATTPKSIFKTSFFTLIANLYKPKSS